MNRHDEYLYDDARPLTVRERLFYALMGAGACLFGGIVALALLS